jgi:exopolysaccharide production protein ExoQ
MPPIVASILTWCFIFWLFRRDLRQKPNVTRALWIPFAWLVINCSRPIAVWLNMLGLPIPGGASFEEGTPVDAAYQLGLIFAGLYVLWKRNVSLANILRSNSWIVLYLAYCLLATFWSDYTFVALKRWFKDLGLPIMASMVVLTEPDPMEALVRLIKRCAYVLIPLSFLLTKYYPQWGRAYDSWTGWASDCGVGQDKNFLGVDCLITGFVFIWYLLQIYKTPREDRDKSWWGEWLLSVGFLAMIGRLFYLCDSRTPLVALVVGVSVMLFAGWKRVRKEFIGAYLLGIVLLVCVVQITFDPYDNVLKLLGRQPTLTGRTDLWHDLLQLKDINPVIGVGFESFWMGKQLELPKLWERQVNESHNGYLEIYLTLGAVGLLLLLAMVFAAYRKACAELLRNVEWGRFRLGILAAVIAYNWTEAGFRALNPVEQMFYIVALDYPKQKLKTIKRPVLVADEEEEAEPAVEAVDLVNKN